MPTYQYQCDGCGYGFEKYQSITEAKLKKCPKCKKDKLCRLIGGGGGFVLKGSGFYQNDYKGCPAEKASSGGSAKPACPAAQNGSCSCC
ncbi:MAG: zinc ribbon domain-containing protein [Candidatus Omnitrophica bacterium]|nr:zinc ribbon domain-containing protein [Candidatus Omnitrophota bacterium]